MRSVFLLALAVALATALSAQPSTTFFSTFDAERGSVVVPARDGNLWLGGQKDERVLLVQLNPEGKILDKHSLGFEGADLDLEHLTDLFEETDGTLVGCGNFEGDNLGRGFVFRYDPQSRQMLWAHIVRSGSLNYLFGITQLGSGGDYVLYGNLQVLFGSDDAELLQIDRATGQIVPGKAKRIHFGSTDKYNQLVYHEGALYTCGHFTDGNGGFSRMRHVVCKIETATLEPVWTRIGPVPGNADARLEGRDLIVDGDAVISTFGGNLTDPFWLTATVFLQKNGLDGTLLWTRQYDLPEWNGEVAEEIINLPDGYLLYGHDLASDTSRLFLLKTDKDGNAIWARKIAYGYNDEFPDLPARSKILRAGDALFLTALSQNAVGQTQGILVKTDLNGAVSDSCAYLQTVAVFPIAIAQPVSEAVVPTVSAGTATQTPATVSVNLPDLTFSKKCGATGACPTLPDLKATLDSIVCVDGNPLLYFTVCNIGGQPYDGPYFFYIYDKNPLTDTARLLTGTIASGDQPILPGDCSGGFPLSSDLIASMPFELDTFTKLYSLIGTTFSVQAPIPLSGFPYPPNLPECSYLNNLDSISVPAQLCGDCKTPVTFVKKLGEPQRRELASSMCAASDGNVYIAGKQGENPMIAKITTRGEPIWVRNFPQIHPNEPIEWASIIEDSDGMLVLCGTEGASPSNRRAIAMRYDPASGTVLWYQRYPSNKPVGVAIVEKSPGGNFALQTNIQTVGSGGVGAQTVFYTLNRADGNTTGSSVGYLNLNNNITTANTLMNNGNLYTVGSWSAKTTDETRPFFAKINPGTFIPEWAYLLDSDTSSGAARWMPPTDVAFDGDIAVIAGSGHLNPLTPTEQIFVYLQKHNPDGSLLWAKRYDMAMVPEEVLTVTNAYIVFGRMVGTNSFGMLKTDVHGNVLLARVLTAAPTSPVSVGFAARQHLILRLPSQLLMLDHTWENNESDLVLLRTDLNFGLDNDCDLLQDVPVSSRTLTATTIPAPLSIGTNTPASAATPASAVFQTDSLSLRKLCPVCDSDTDPDPCKPATFIKQLGEPGKIENLSAMCAAPDGNLYLSGLKGTRTAIAKMTPEGKFLWTRSFVAEPYEPVIVAEIIVDSEGMIVGSGRKGSGTGAKGFAFRYDPAANQMLWAQEFINNLQVQEGGILENTPGGNYVLYQNAFVDSLLKRPEVLELDRTTGQIMPAFAKRYNLTFADIAFTAMVAHNGHLYATGYGTGIFGARKMLMATLDANTGAVVNSKAMHYNWNIPAYFSGSDLIVDDTSVVVLYHGNETSYSISDGSGAPVPLFLQKFSLDNKSLWVRKYMVTTPPKELVAVPDGYIMLGGREDRYLLKTDKEGNLLLAKRLENPPVFNINNGEQQNQLVVSGNNLFLADVAQTTGADQYTTLLKTDLNLELDFVCHKYTAYPTSDSMATDQATPYPLGVAPSPTTQQAVSAALAVDNMTLRETCPACPNPPCTDKPDIVFEIESVGCDSAVFVTYRLCNTGEQPFAGTLQVGVYDSNPLAGAATLLDLLVLQNLNLLPDSCQTGTLGNLAYWGNNTTVYTLAGIESGQTTPVDPAGFPYNGIAECDYANNLDSLNFQYPPAPLLDLGPNTNICPGDSLLLGAGLGGFVSYTWQDGSHAPTYLANVGGLFTLSTVDGCGRTASDNISIGLKIQPKTTREYVLLPGDSVLIGGVVYKTSTQVITFTSSTTGGCDTLVTHDIRLDSLHCDRPGSFFKIFKGLSSRVVLPAADSGYYVGGGSAQGYTLAKFGGTGKNLWARHFNLAVGSALVQTLIEDSEGILVGSATSEGSPSSVLVFRYNPATDQTLWVKHYTTPFEEIRGYEVVEIKPGGDYLLAFVRRTSAADFSTEMVTFDRATGNIAGGGVWRYDKVAALTSIEVKQDTLYAFGLLRDTSVGGLFWRNGLMKIDLNTGTPVWAKATKTADADLFGGNLLLDDDSNLVSTMIQSGQAIWLQKTAPNGNLLWLKKIRLLDPTETQFFPVGLVRLNDGYAIGIQTSPGAGGLHSYVVVKTDKNGDLLWAKKVPKVGGTFTISPHQLAGRGNEVCFTTNLYQQVFQFTGIILGKFDKYGNIGETCSLVEDSPVAITQQAGTQVAALVNFAKINGAFNSTALANAIPLSLQQSTLCSRCLPPCDSIAVQQTLDIYPGDTVYLAGTPYTQPDTVTLTLSTDDGCDSVVTYILRLVVTNVDLACPGNLTVPVPANQSSVNLTYPLPTATTDCPDPDIVLTLLQGLPVGGAFPVGETMVCYEAANHCGIRDTCCFRVSIQPAADETACDVKIPPGSCIKYELLSIRLDSLGRPRYRMRLTNTCSSPLRFAYFQLPNSMTAKAPLEGATYTAPSGNTYLVRNPNAARFHSIRFKPLSGNLNNGESDIFEYTLPKQAQQAFILVSAKLEDGSSSEAHINTFGCPVQPYVATVHAPKDGTQNRNAPVPEPAVFVRPNPTTGLLFVEITGGQNQSTRIQVLNAQGQLVLEEEHSPGSALQLPEGLAKGLYFLVVQPADGSARVATRFVLER